MDSKILLPGHYNLIGVIDPDNAIKETKENNNLLRGAKINVSYIVGEMAKHSDVSSIALRDSDGTQFNLAISGPGQAQLNPVTGGYSLTVIGSDASTRINLNNTSGGDGKISLVDIDIQGTLASLNAASAIISGTANFNNISELVVGESTATATIQAESIGQLSVINNAGGQWRINNTAAIPNAVADIKIGGTLYGKWQINGGVSSITAEATDIKWQANVRGSLTKITTRANASGLLAAASLGDVTVGGSITHMGILVGVDLGSDQAIGGIGDAEDHFIPGTLSSLHITGDIVSSYIAASVNHVNGVYDDGDDLMLGGVANKIQGIVIGGHISNSRIK